MLIDTSVLLQQARANNFAVGAFNIYNLEGATAVIQGAEQLESPVILQLLPGAIAIGGSPLIALCLELARKSTVPVSVHLDHCNDEDIIVLCLKSDLISIMADGSALSYNDNIQFTKKIVTVVSQNNGWVEAELGKLSGSEDGITVSEREAQLTDPGQAADFVGQTGIGALAVCIGNMHGKYLQPPELDFDRLGEIAQCVSIPLVLHGTSGLPDTMIREAIGYGVSKFNVNTEVRSVYLKTMREGFATSSQVELVTLMQDAISAMKKPVQAKIKLFCSANKAKLFNAL